MSPVRQTTRAAPPADLTTPLQYLKGVGPERAKLLARKGLVTVEDALFFLPIRHEDRTRLTPLRSIRVGERLDTLVQLSDGPPVLHRQRYMNLVVQRQDRRLAQALKTVHLCDAMGLLQRPPGALVVRPLPEEVAQPRVPPPLGTSPS